MGQSMSLTKGKELKVFDCPPGFTYVVYICTRAYKSLGKSVPRLCVITSDLCVF